MTGKSLVLIWLHRVLLAGALLAGAGSAALAAEAPVHEVLDLPEVATLLRVPQRQVLQMAQAHELPGRLIGGQWRFSRKGVLNWLAGQGPDAAAVPPDPAASGPSDWPRQEIGQIDLASIMSAAPEGHEAGAAVAQAPTVQAAAAEANPGSAESAVPAPSPDARPGAGAQASAASGQPSAPAAAAEAGSVGARPSGSSAQEIALRDQGALLRRGTGSVEMGLYHTHGEQTLVPVLRQEQSAFGLNTTLRYGLADDVQLAGSLPVVRNTTTVYTAGAVSGTTQRQDSSESHWGDASLSLLAVAMRESTWRPNLIFSLDAVLPTGPGDRGIGAGLVASKSFDPAVIFAGLSYVQGLSVDPTDDRRALARHNFGLNLGYTYALNDALALNTVFSDTWRDAAAPDANSLPPPGERYQLQFGMTWMMGHGVFLEPAVALRLGGANPDLTESANLVLAY